MSPVRFAFTSRDQARLPLESAGLKPDFRFFDLLRGIAAILVLVSHVRDLVMRDFPGGSILVKTFYFVTGLGHQAVMLFFVLSGFWIAKAVQSRVQRGAWTFSGYLVDRLTRLWIVLVPAIILGAAFDLIGFRLLSLPLYSNHLGAHSLPEHIGSDLGFKVALGNFFFLQTILVSTFGSNGPLWSLAREFWYYVWFPGLYLAWRVTSGLPRIVLTLTFLSVGEVALPGFLCWMVGVLLFITKDGFQGVKPRFAIVGFCISMTVLVLALAASKVSKLPEWLSDDVIGSVTLLLLWFWMRGRLAIPDITQSLAQFGALSSFSLYATHLPLALFVVAEIVRTSRLTFGWNSLLIVLAVCLACMLVSIIFSRLTEQRTSGVRAWLRGTLNSAALRRWNSDAGSTSEAGQRR